MKAGARAALVKDNLPAINAAVRDLTSRQVLVGFPAANAQRTPEPGQKGPVTNAMLGYVHDKGSPAQNIPQREFMRTGIMEAREKIQARLAAAGRAAIQGAGQAVEDAFQATGLIAVNAIRNKLRSGPFAPLSPKTLADRRRRGRKGEKPLNDTGQLARAVAYLLGRKGR